MKSTPVRLIQALDQIRIEEGITHGTNALIEAIRAEYHLSYEEIAAAGDVSVAGLARWRKNNYGEHPRVVVLLEWAKARINAGDEKTSSPSEAVRSHSIGDIEAHLNNALKKLLGENAVQAVKISELKPSEEGELQIILRVL